LVFILRLDHARVEETIGYLSLLLGFIDVDVHSIDCKLIVFNAALKSHHGIVLDCQQHKRRCSVSWIDEVLASHLMHTNFLGVAMYQNIRV
jgi:hypothetical protein